MSLRDPATWFGLVLVLAPAAPGAAQEAPSAEKLLNLSDSDWPPYYLPDGGFAREMLDTCLGEAGYTTRYRTVSIEQAYEGLRRGVVDAHIFSRRPDREAFLIFGSEPLFHDAYQPIVLAGKAAAIDSLEDFDELRLGHLAGLRYDEEFLAYVQQRRNAGRLVQVASNEDLLDALIGGKIDVFVNLTSTVRWLARQRGVADRIAVAPFVVKGSDYFLSIGKSSPRIADPQALLDAVDTCVRAMKADGRYLALAQRYDLD